MNTIYTDRTDQTINAMINRTFPGYRGKKVRVSLCDSMVFSGTQWDGGSRSQYSILRLSDMSIVPIAAAPFMQRSALHENECNLSVGFVVVELDTFRGKDSICIHSCAGNMQKLLGKAPDLTDDEKIVLVATSTYKNTYAGETNIRFRRAHRKTGISAERWETAKSALIERKLLNRAGAITNAGRNATSTISANELKMH